MASSDFFVPPTASTSDENGCIPSTVSTFNSADTSMQLPLGQQIRDPPDELDQILRVFEALTLQPQQKQHPLQSELPQQLQLPTHYETHRSQPCRELETSLRDLAHPHPSCPSALNYSGLYGNHPSLNLQDADSSELPLSSSFPAASGSAPSSLFRTLDFLTPGALKTFLDIGFTNKFPSSTVRENTTSAVGPMYPRSEESARCYNSSSTPVVPGEYLLDKSVGKSCGDSTTPCPSLSLSSFNDNYDSQPPNNDEYYCNYSNDILPLVPHLQQFNWPSSPSTSTRTSPLHSELGNHCVSHSLDSPSDLTQKEPINNFEALVVEFLRNGRIFASTSPSTSIATPSMSSSTCGCNNTSTCTCGNCSNMTTSAATFSSAVETTSSTSSPNDFTTSNPQPSSKNGLSPNSINSNPLTTFPGLPGNVTTPLSRSASRNPSPPKLPVSFSASTPLCASSLPCQFSMSRQQSLDEFVKASSSDRTLISTSLSAKLPALFDTSRGMSPSNSSSQGHHKSSFDSEISEETLNSPLAHQRPQSEGSEGKRLFVKILVTEEIADIAFHKNAQELKALVEKTQTEVDLSPDGHFFPGSHKRPVAISGATESSFFAVLGFFLELLLQQSQNEPGGPTKARCAVAVPRIVIGSLIGKNGSYIQSVRLMTGAHVYVSPLFVRADEACSERLVTISSRDRSSLRAATFTIARKINEHMANARCRSVMYHRKHMPSVPGSCSSSDTTPSGKRQASCSFDIDVGGHVSPAVLARSSTLCSTSPVLPQQLPKKFNVSGRRQASSSFDIDKTGHVAEPSSFQIPHNLFLDDRESPKSKKPLGGRPPSYSIDDCIGYR